MCAFLRDAAAVDHKDLICVADRLEAVCDQDDGLFLVRASMAAVSSVSFSGSTLAVASSRMMTGASFKMARAMEMRCFSPPDRLAPPSPMTVS